MILRWKRVRPLLVIIGLLMLVLWTVQAQDAAIVLDADETASGTVDADNLADVYRFEADAGSTISLTLTSDAAVAMMLTNAEGVTLGEATIEGGAASLADLLIAATGQFFVTVFSTGDGGE
jgi:hypothetical protein